MTRSSLLALTACVIACACARESDATEPSFVLRNVCRGEIDALARSIPARVVSKPDAELRERVLGLVPDLAHAQGKARSLALRDVGSIGSPAVPVLEELADDAKRDPNERAAALEALGAIDAPESADALAKRVDVQVFREPWVRARAAFELAKQSSDAWIPRLTAQLKYETDGETVVWMAAALAKHENYAGLDGLRVLSTRTATSEIGALAAATLAQVAKDAGFESGEALYAAWHGADVEHRVPAQSPSPALRLEIWKRIAALSEFDLRIVDDARFALVGSAAWVVEPLVAALHDENEYVRLHATQCLQRMGARASAACPELVKALDEPHVAPTVAAALGDVGCTAAIDDLIARTSAAHDPELRAAAAAALGRMDARSAMPALRALLVATEPIDLRQTAAESLLRLGDESASVALLAECLTRPGADGGAAESALEAWFAKRASIGTTEKERFAAWTKLGAAIEGTPTLEQANARRKARAALVSATSSSP